MSVVVILASARRTLRGVVSATCADGKEVKGCRWGRLTGLVLTMK